MKAGKNQTIIPVSKPHQHDSSLGIPPKGARTFAHLGTEEKGMDYNCDDSVGEKIDPVFHGRILGFIVR